MKSEAAKSGIYLVSSTQRTFPATSLLIRSTLFYVWVTFINIKYVNYYIHYIHRIFLVKFIPDAVEVKMFKLLNCLLLGLCNFHFLGEITRNFFRRANGCIFLRKRDNFAGVRTNRDADSIVFMILGAPRGRFIHGRHETERSGMHDSLILRHNARGADLSREENGPLRWDPRRLPIVNGIINRSVPPRVKGSSRGCTREDAPQSFEDAPFGGSREERSFSRVLRG